ncbi:uncharacterized protein C8A04DRAFT_24059 [Dichotomopilus funicola]|uniref:Rhodopsin domain-containing protein n=1 Tax=Dichotomopilus funicola TaxID=1934379 RepID=A0AAN6VB82_9PEZI|nr:hypothetical protein C8A04DRAFT_24059 [Dichotomopilus funicola]
MGWTYNTRDPDAPTIGPMITGVAIALTLLSLVTTCLRTYVRARMIKAFGIDDWMILITWFCAAGFAIITVVQTKWGLGLLHIQDLPDEDVYNFGLLQYIGAPFYITSILGFKLALLSSYVRFVPLGIYRNILFGVITTCILFHLSFLLVQLNLCQPVRKQWDPAVTDGSCVASVPFYTSMASITIVFDVTVYVPPPLRLTHSSPYTPILSLIHAFWGCHRMLLPFPVLHKSHLQTRKKLILFGLFGLGIFITVIQIIRIQTVKQLVNYVDSAPLILWSSVENNLGIIVANVPTLAPLVKYYNVRSSRGGGISTSGKMNKNGTGNSAGMAVGAVPTIGSATARGWRHGSSGSRGSVDELATWHDTTEMGSFGGSASAVCAKGGGSMDSILLDKSGSDSGSSHRPPMSRDGEKIGDTGERCVTPRGITKRVEVVVTRT